MFHVFLTIIGSFPYNVFPNAANFGSTVLCLICYKIKLSNTKLSGLTIFHIPFKSLAIILFFHILQYIAANPGVQGTYMPQYPPMQAPPVSLSYLSLKEIHLLASVHLTMIYLKAIIVLENDNSPCESNPLPFIRP